MKENDELSKEVKRTVRIHIDREVYESPSPTTGMALYALAHIPAEREIFQEAEGNQEDVPVPRDENKINLKIDDHFYSEREIVIIVNGRQKVVTKKELSFAELVVLAFDNPPSGENILFTITYRKGPHQNSEGTLLEGITIKIKKGMVFNVSATDKS